MYRLLLLTDDAKLTKQLKSPLSDAGYAVTAVSLTTAHTEDWSPARTEAVLCDIGHVPDPAHLCRTLARRPALKDVPLVLLAPETLVPSLEWRWGFEEFIPLPASAQAVVARLQFLLWRLNRVDVKNGLKLGDLLIDFEQFTVSVSGQVVDLTYKEYELLRFLATHPGKVFTREVLLNKVWGYDFYGGTRTVDVHIRRLRSKLEDAHHTFIDTIRHVGYKFLPPEE